VKLVNGTRISIGKVSNGKTGLPLQTFRCSNPEISTGWNDTKSRVPFTSQMECPVFPLETFPMFQAIRSHIFNFGAQNRARMEPGNEWNLCQMEQVF